MTTDILSGGIGAIIGSTVVALLENNYLLGLIIFLGVMIVILLENIISIEDKNEGVKR